MVARVHVEPRELDPAARLALLSNEPHNGRPLPRHGCAADLLVVLNHDLGRALVLELNGLSPMQHLYREVVAAEQQGFAIHDRAFLAHVVLAARVERA